jgi:hypothetical protein
MAVAAFAYRGDRAQVTSGGVSRVGVAGIMLARRWIGAGFGGLDRCPHRLAGDEVEVGGGGGMSAATRTGPSSWMRRLSPWRWMPVMVAGRRCEGCRPGAGVQGHRRGWERDEHIAVEPVRRGEGEPVGENDGVVFGRAGRG